LKKFTNLVPIALWESSGRFIRRGRWSLALALQLAHRGGEKFAGGPLAAPSRVVPGRPEGTAGRQLVLL
jgi:hypothetical protein